MTRKNMYEFTEIGWALKKSKDAKPLTIVFKDGSTVNTHKLVSGPRVSIRDVARRAEIKSRYTNNLDI